MVLPRRRAGDDAGLRVRLPRRPAARPPRAVRLEFPRHPVLDLARARPRRRRDAPAPPPLPRRPRRHLRPGHRRPDRLGGFPLLARARAAVSRALRVWREKRAARRRPKIRNSARAFPPKTAVSHPRAARLARETRSAPGEVEGRSLCARVETRFATQGSIQPLQVAAAVSRDFRKFPVPRTP